MGASVAIADDQVLVGAPTAAAGGAVYAFEWNGSEWTETQKLTGGPGEGFGGSLAMGANVALIGAVGASDAGTLSGAAYVFDGPVWTESARLVAEDAAQFDTFGTAVAVDTAIGLIGAPRNDEAAPDSGAVYMAAVAPCLSTYCVSAANSVGAGGQIGHFGTPSVSANDFTVRAGFCPSGQPGVFFYGAEQAQTPFGDGVLCVAATSGVFRLNPPVAIDGQGAALRLVDFASPPAGPIPGDGPLEPGIVTPGSRWNFQFWYRDPAAGGAGSNLTNGLSVVFVP